MAQTTVDFYLYTCFPTCSLVMCLWMTMPHVACGGFLSVSKLLAGTVDMCVYHSTYVTFALWPLALAS